MCVRKKVDTERNIKTAFKVTGIWQINVVPMVKPVFFNEEVIYMSLVRASNTPQSLPQPKLQEHMFTAILLWWVDIELNSKEHTMEFLETAFQILSHEIQGLFSDGASSLKTFENKVHYTENNQPTMSHDWAVDPWGHCSEGHRVPKYSKCTMRALHKTPDYEEPGFWYPLFACESDRSRGGTTGIRTLFELWRPRLELLSGNNFVYLFGEPCLFGNTEDKNEILSQKTRTKWRPETYSLFGMHDNCSSTRNCENYKAIHCHSMVAVELPWGRAKAVSMPRRSRLLQKFSSLSLFALSTKHHSTLLNWKAKKT